ncbi:hypothetical protein Tco_0898922, partial [Tanacetum coccineum]
VLQTKDKKLYVTRRVEIFNLNEWVWSPLPDLVKWPFCVQSTSTWEILTPPAPTLECDQAGTLKPLVKYSGKYWKKPIKAGLYDANTRAMADRGTIISYMFKGGETDHSSQIFSFRSDFEPADLMVG